jgi:hypothetical protein
VTDHAGGIQGDEIAELCAKDWGMYTTFRKSLAALLTKAMTMDEESRRKVSSKVEKLVSMMDSHPKSLSWRMRARIGEKARWYELPESDSDTVFG